ncbi:MAG TPA: Asp-tRNA(Asn)/Glu-tRNA(Gln) amidotransferase GatCAB subunit B, partial [Pseudomonadales bacterium]|nr:Asp-tRNA(Asn)/Glu-tRNA(Gln) amidotransferase GatCAB subunit B [Pseudomonadales bacterium]
KDETRPMRSKETSKDYRYFPEPDLLPVEIDQAYIDSVRRSMPELPRQKVARFVSQYELAEADANVLASSSELANYFEEVVKIGGDARHASNWVRVELLGLLHRDEKEIGDSPVNANELGTIIARIVDGTISGKIAKSVFEALWEGRATSADDYIMAEGLTQVSDTGALEPVIDAIIDANPEQVAQFKSGKTKLLGFFVGQVMKETGGKANPQQVNELVTKKLGD